MTCLAVVLASTVLAAPVTAASAADDYPTWAEVDAAQSSAAATAAEVQRIESALDGLQARAAELGDTAVTETALAAVAQAELVKATTQQTVLTTQADAASARAGDSAQRLGVLGAQLYRSGGNSLAVGAVFDGGEADDLLFQLGAMSRLTEQAGLITEQADTERNAAEALTAQAELKMRERDRLHNEALLALAATETAQQAADAEVALKQAAGEVLYAQLASLKNTSAAVERQYRTGVTAQHDYEEQQQQAAENAAAGDVSLQPNVPSVPSAPSAPSAPTGPTVPPISGTVDRPGAQRIAAAQVAARGWGDAELTCLVSLWQRESGWRVNAYNASSGAYGIPQSLPGSKMASAGDDWQTNPATQISWGLGYIASRYGTPCAAWAHSETHNWY
ncbi:coiled-coil domain-containing protein [Cryobacterium aureum]|uniref:coiled-coil domain-containing protein n=1 Tax=Cryobacterium aureum TaxID=995037 RepID=UPI00196AF5A3|nr:hypothetical protein [Cryobacterium aureum]